MLKKILGGLILLLCLTACQEAEPTPAGPPTPTPALPVSAITVVPSPAPVTMPATTPLPPTAGTATTSPSPTATAPPSLTPSPTLLPTPEFPAYTGPPLPPATIGVQVQLHRQDVTVLIGHLQTLNVGWVKTQISWKLFQPEPERLDETWFAEVDALVAAADAAGINVLLSVAKAPEWSRPTTSADGPPADFNHYTTFMELLARRYQGRVAAYELWNEPNLAREWTGLALDPAHFADLIRAGAAGVRAGDPVALVISGAPAPTGIDDGVNARADRPYFAGMLAAGVADVVDGVGIHPYGWANPPASRFGDPAPGVSSHNDHPTFFFYDTVMDYRELLLEYDRPDLPLWATEFGWGTFADLSLPPPAGAEFMNDVTPYQQAEYTLDALALAQAWDWLGPMFLWNLNFAPALGPGFSESGYSLLAEDGFGRPVYYALRAALRP